MKISKLLCHTLCSVIVLGSLPIFKVDAFQLNPISQEFSPAGQQSTRSYRISNPRDEPIAVDLAVFSRSISESGEETLLPADEDFIIYPPQMIVPPLATQTVRVTWVGDAEPDSELSYRFVAEQLPVTLEPSDGASANTARPTGGVRMMMRYAGSLYIRPANVAAQLGVQEARLKQGENGENLLLLKIKNEGSSRGKLSRMNVQLSAAGQRVNLPLKGLLGESTPVILAGGERHFLLPWPAELPVDEVTGKLIPEN